MAIDKNQQSGTQMPKQQRSQDQDSSYRQAGQRDTTERTDRTAERSTSSSTTKSNRRDEDVDADMNQDDEE